MLIDWIKIVDAVGFEASRLSIPELYELSSKILADSIVKERRLTKIIRSGPRRGILPQGATLEVIAEMKHSERLALRTRLHI